MNPNAPAGDIQRPVINKCVGIDPAADFVDEPNGCPAGTGQCAPGTCPKRSNPADTPKFLLVDFAHPTAIPAGSQNYSIPKGYYEFVDRTPDISLSPTICAYHREGN